MEEEGMREWEEEREREIVGTKRQRGRDIKHRERESKRFFRKRIER